MHKIKTFRRGINLGLEFATNDEKPFPLPSYCGFGDVTIIASAAQSNDRPSSAILQHDKATPHNARRTRDIAVPHWGTVDHTPYCSGDLTRFTGCERITSLIEYDSPSFYTVRSSYRVENSSVLMS